MKSNVFRLEPPAAAAAAVEVEPLEEAVRELSACIRENNEKRRRHASRAEELRTLSPWLRRRGRRQAPPAPSRPVTFFSIEEAEASESAPLTAA